MLSLMLATAILGAAAGKPAMDPSIDISNRIYNGSDASEGEFPFMASFQYPDGSHTCGASILTPDWLLTAAHCCPTDGSAMQVYVGSVYLSKGGKTYPVRKTILHEDYGSNPNYGTINDICLLNVETPIQFSDVVQPIFLPAKDLSLPIGTPVTTIGWGRAINPGPDRLQVLYNETIATCKGNLYDGRICAIVGAGHSICSGDSGSPLFNNRVQIGISSLAWECGLGANADLFTRVPLYVDWIYEVLGSSAQDLQFADPNKH